MRASLSPPSLPPALDVVTIRTTKGANLVVELVEPATRVRGTALLAHGLGESRAAFDVSTGIASRLRDDGWRIVALDFRGHGQSTPPSARAARWTYDELVREDLPAIVAALRDRFDGPLVIVGHGLGGHVAAASLGPRARARGRTRAARVERVAPPSRPLARATRDETRRPRNGDARRTRARFDGRSVRDLRTLVAPRCVVEQRRSRRLPCRVRDLAVPRAFADLHRRSPSLPSRVRSRLCLDRAPRDASRRRRRATVAIRFAS